jgi:D-alanyl-D-alanine carboxypeptidase/D-alanyl-D-alanine-endopeptidase (penicillin-binding protein 4)
VQEQLEQQELGARELDRPPAAAHGVLERVELDVGVAQRLAALAGAATQQRPQTREQLFERERLDEVVVGAGVEPAHAVGHRVARGQHEDRRAVTGRAQPPAHLEAVDVRHQQVEHERVRGPVGQRLQRLGAVGGQLRVVALEPQRSIDGFAHRGLVVDDQDAHAVMVSAEAESVVRVAACPIAACSFSPQSSPSASPRPPRRSSRVSSPPCPRSASPASARSRPG